MAIARSVLGLWLVLACGLAWCGSFPAPTAAASAKPRVCRVNFKKDFVIRTPNTGIIADIEIDERCNVIVRSQQTVSAKEAAQRVVMAGTVLGVQREHVVATFTQQPSILAVTNNTCHSYIGVLDPVNIELTGVTHHTNWDWNGVSVGLRTMSTNASWHYTTGWSNTAGPNQWVIDGNGGASDKTHGEAAYQWLGGLHAHTLKADNKVNSNGTCNGTLSVVGAIPSISHTTTSVWVN